MTEYDSADDVAKCFEAAYAAIRERVARGGPSWIPKLNFTLVGQQQRREGTDYCGAPSSQARS